MSYFYFSQFSKSFWALWEWIYKCYKASFAHFQLFHYYSGRAGGRPGAGGNKIKANSAQLSWDLGWAWQYQGTHFLQLLDSLLQEIWCCYCPSNKICTLIGSLFICWVVVKLGHLLKPTKLYRRRLARIWTFSSHIIGFHEKNADMCADKISNVLIWRRANMSNMRSQGSRTPFGVSRICTLPQIVQCIQSFEISYTMKLFLYLLLGVINEWLFTFLKLNYITARPFYLLSAQIERESRDNLPSTLGRKITYYWNFNKIN
jgi:hypothetical protein